jgi:1,4-dihydroxy-2-naphthoate octaprenyltransferase
MFKPLSLEFIILSLPYLFFNVSLIFLTIIPDTTGDKATAKHTFAVRYGLKTTITVSFLFFLLTFVIAIVNRDALILLLVLLTSWWELRLVLKQNKPSAIKMVKMAIFFFSMLICFKFSVYFLVMVSVFFLTRFYYRRRFQYDYPNFKGD